MSQPTITVAQLAAAHPGDAALCPISVLDERRLEVAFKRPQAPMGKDPNAGSKAEQIRRTDDPGYLQAFAQWNDQCELLRFAISAGVAIEVDGAHQPFAAVAEHPQEAKIWCATVAEQMSALVTRLWMIKAVETLDRLSVPELMADAAKN